MSVRRGQTILEYTIIVGIIVVVLYYMGTGIKRGVQSLVKVTADQVGNQQKSDQNFKGPQGFVQESNTQIQQNKDDRVTEIGYVPASGTAIYSGKKSVDERNFTLTNTITNGGFTPNR